MGLEGGNASQGGKESEMKQDWEEGQTEKDSGGNTATDWRREEKPGWQEERRNIKMAFKPSRGSDFRGGGGGVGGWELDSKMKEEGLWVRVAG